MSDASAWQQVIALVREHEYLIEAIVFLLGFAESLVLVSFFVPASVLFLAIAALHSAGDGPFIPILLAGAVGCLTGDIVSYAIGWRLRRRVRSVWPFSARPDLLVRSRLMIRRHGVYAIFASKFIGPLRPVTPMFAGATYMPWASFAGASAASSLLWALAFLAPTYYGLQLLS
ncbi:MAG: DedA family protein [Hyphomicrobiaceae bacterium]